MSRINIQFSDKALQNHLSKIIDSIEKKERKAILRKGSRIVAKQLKADTPVDSGALAQSVRPITWTRSRDYFVGHMAKPARYNRKKGKATDPFFAAFLNEGWTHTWKPRPIGAVKKGTKNAFIRYIGKHKNFIQKATDKAAPATLKKIESEVAKIISNP